MMIISDIGSFCCNFWVRGHSNAVILVHTVGVFLCYHGDNEQETGLPSVSRGWRHGGGVEGGGGDMKSSQRADELMAQVKWKGMCLDIRGMIVARSDDTETSFHTQEVRCGKMPLQRQTETMFLSITAVWIIQLMLHKYSRSNTTKSDFLSSSAETTSS